MRDGRSCNFLFFWTAAFETLSIPSYAQKFTMQCLHKHKHKRETKGIGICGMERLNPVITQCPSFSLKLEQTSKHRAASLQDCNIGATCNLCCFRASAYTMYTTSDRLRIYASETFLNIVQWPYHRATALDR